MPAQVRNRISPVVPVYRQPQHLLKLAIRLHRRPSIQKLRLQNSRNPVPRNHRMYLILPLSLLTPTRQPIFTSPSPSETVSTPSVSLGLSEEVPVARASPSDTAPPHTHPDPIRHNQYPRQNPNQPVFHSPNSYSSHHPATLLHKLRPLRPRLPPMHRRLRAPLRRQPSHPAIRLLIKPQQIAHHPPVQQRPVRVRIRQIRRLQLLVPKLLKNALRRLQLLIAERAKVQYR